MQDRNENLPRIDALESRTLLSGGGHWHFGGGRHPHVPANPSPAVQADLTKIAQDQQTLDADRVTQAPKLVTDRDAIQSAIAALDSQLTPLKQARATDAATWRQTIDADWQAITQDRVSGDATQLATDKAKLKTDRTAARTALKADRQAIHDLISNDAGVKAAKTQLATDQKVLQDDRAVLDADYKQLRIDIRAQRDAGSTPAT